MVSTSGNRKQRPIAGRLYYTAGVTLLALGFFTFVVFSLSFRYGLAGGTVSILGLLAIVFIGTGAGLFVQGKKMLALLKTATIESDQRPPILYLRSFGDEQATLGRLALYRWLSPVFVWAALKTPEESLAEALGSLGPVLALGRPGEELPELGATRVYVADEEWQRTVTDLIKKAQLIVLRGGYSEGLKWELSKVLADCAPRKVLLTLPAGKDYVKFHEWTSAVLPKPLPAKSPNAVYVAFDADWTPIPLPTRSIPGLTSASASDTVVRSIGPFLRAAGYELPPPRPPIRVVRILVLLLLVLIFSIAVFLVLAWITSLHHLSGRQTGAPVNGVESGISRKDASCPCSSLRGKKAPSISSAAAEVCPEAHADYHEKTKRR